MISSTKYERRQDVKKYIEVLAPLGTAPVMRTKPGGRVWVRLFIPSLELGNCFDDVMKQRVAA